MFCKFCSRGIPNKGGLSTHENSCRLNPNPIKRIRSPYAGAQKGVSTWNKGIKMGRNELWEINFSFDKVFIENSTYPRHSLKKRIIDNQLIIYQCACCGLGPYWNNKPMPLILDHINGVNNDNRLSNLRFVCSNCDSQLDTYKSKNKTKLLDSDVKIG